MTKRIWIAAAFVLCALTVWAQKASDFQTDGSGVITGYTGSAKVVVIPSKIGNREHTRSVRACGARNNGSAGGQMPLRCLFQGGSLKKTRSAAVRPIEMKFF